MAGISGGQAKRLSIATEYLALPGIFCLDEPTTGLDSFTSLQIGELPLRLNSFSLVCLWSRTLIALRVLHSISLSHYCVMFDGAALVLKRLAKVKHKTVLLTVHQPSVDMLQQWDNLVSGQCAVPGLLA